MIRTPLAVLGLSAAAAVGGSLLASGTASAAQATAETAPVAAAPATYTVVSGDSLWAIGQRYGIPMGTLAADNDMNLNETLAVGKILTLSGATATPSTAASTPASTSSASTEAASTPTHSTSTFGQGSLSAVTPKTSNSVSPGSALEACIIEHESRGNAQIMNSSGHWGLYQFSEGTWIAYGGTASNFGNAPASVQQQVFDNAIARGGASNWTEYDGC